MQREGKNKPKCKGYSAFLTCIFLPLLALLIGCPARQQIRHRATTPPQRKPTQTNGTNKQPIKTTPIAKRAVPTKRTTPRPMPRRRPTVFVRGTQPLTNPSKRRARRRIQSSYASTFAYRYYLRGRIHAIESRPKKAIRSFKMALVYDRDSAFLRHCIATQFAKANQLPKARYWAKQAVKFKKSFAPAYSLLGEIAIRYKQLKQAIRYFRLAVKHSPTFATAYLKLDQLLQQRPKTTRQRERLLKRMLRHLPNRFEGYFLLAQLYLGKDQKRKAVQYFKKALNYNPSHQPSLFQVARIHEQKREWGKAIRAYQVLLDYQPGAWQTRIVLACLYFKRNEKHDKQVAAFHFRYIMREADRLVPSARAYQIGLGLYHCKLQTKAAKWLKKATTIDKNNIAAQLALGVVYNKIGHSAKAIPHLRTIPPTEKGLYVEAQMQLLQALLRNKQTKQAWLALERARIQLARKPDDWLRLSQVYVEYAPKPALSPEQKQLDLYQKQLPNHKGLLHVLALLHFRLKQYETSTKFLKAILKLDAKHAASLNFLGYMLAVRGKQLKKAEQLVRKALSLSPDNPYYLDSLGWVYKRQGKFHKARTTLEKAFRLLPHDPTILVHLAKTYIRMGKRTKAKAMLLKAKALNPPEPLKKEIETTLKQFQAHPKTKPTTTKTT
jgi:tetratricopeptide (TPR) repeat protein